MNARLIVLLAALAATLAAVWWVEERASGEAAVGPVTTSPRRAAPPVGPTLPPATQPTSARPAGSTADRAARFHALGPDLFPVHSWQPPPPLPFQFLGHWQEGGEEVYFLAQGQHLHSLKRGDSVGPWRLEETAPAGLVFTYVPLNERRTLRLTP